MAEAAELPFSCWVATSGVDPTSSESFGGELDGGGDDVCEATAGGRALGAGLLTVGKER